MTSNLRLRLGTRASALARWQADWVRRRLTELGAEVELVPIRTTGDRQQDPIAAGGAVGVFTREIQNGLLDERIDLAVHSLKDLPTDEVPGLSLSAVPERAAVGDALVCREHDSLEDLPDGAVLGTGSLRRRAQLSYARPELVMEDIRGNVDTRLRKLAEGQYDALVLAEAGLRRLELADRITERLPLELMLPAVAQGALGLETRTDDRPVRALLEKLNHTASHAAVAAERAMLAALEGGCLTPVAAWGRIDGEQLVLSGRVLNREGTARVEAFGTSDPAEAAALGRRVAEDLLVQGAAEMIRQARDSTPPPPA